MVDFREHLFVFHRGFRKIDYLQCLDLSIYSSHCQPQPTARRRPPEAHATLSCLEQLSSMTCDAHEFNYVIAPPCFVCLVGFF